MLCEIKYLITRIFKTSDNVQVFCKNESCRFHENTGEFTVCANPYMAHKHNEKGVVCSYSFVEGCQCADCKNFDCPFIKYEVEETHSLQSNLFVSDVTAMLTFGLVFSIVMWFASSVISWLW